MTGMKRARLSAIALGIAFGVMCGVTMMVVALMAFKGHAPAAEMVTRWAVWLPGVEATVQGSFVALAWGFLKGFVSGLIFGWIYNLCLCCCTKCCACCKCGSDKGSCSTSPKV